MKFLRDALRPLYYKMRPLRVTFFSTPLLSKQSPKYLIKVELTNPRYEDFLLQIADLSKNHHNFSQQRLSDGHLLYVRHVDNQVRGYFWVSIGDRKVPWVKGCTIHFQPDSVYIWDCHVGAQFRNQGIYKSALRELTETDFGSEIRRAYIYCLDSNLPSRSAILSVGFLPIYVATVFSFAFRKVVFAGKSPIKMAGPIVNFSSLI